MKSLSYIFLTLSHLFLYIAVPVCCIIEYYSRKKMGMYRYLVLKNSWWLNNIFTHTTVPFILYGVAVIMLAAILLFCKPWIKSYSFAYGIFLTACNFFLFKPDRFFSLRAAPWFGLALLLSELFFVLGAFLKNNN